MGIMEDFTKSHPELVATGGWWPTLRTVDVIKRIAELEAENKRLRLCIEFADPSTVCVFDDDGRGYTMRDGTHHDIKEDE